MSTRMSKYIENEEENQVSRVNRNSFLYKEISKSELESYDIKSNESILGNQENEIDVEKIKKILDTKYNETPKRKSIKLEETEEDEIEKEITKEYDINVILEKAKENKTVNYEEERLKKLRDTQFDILNNLNFEKSNNENDEDDLKELINTITINESKIKKELEKDDDFDLMADLKGGDDTEVLEGLKEEIDDIHETREMDTKMINSFYTSSNKIVDNDFDEYDDFSKSIESSNPFVTILIIIILIALIVGGVILIKTLYFS